MVFENKRINMKCKKHILIFFGKKIQSMKKIFVWNLGVLFFIYKYIKIIFFYFLKFFYIKTLKQLKKLKIHFKYK
jgi:hypothetical protein